jgi:hypothetical protein
MKGSPLLIKKAAKESSSFESGIAKTNSSNSMHPARFMYILSVMECDPRVINILPGSRVDPSLA